MRETLAVLLLLTLLGGVAHADGFNNIYSPNGVDVWAVGSGGSIYHSIDAGETWYASSAGTSALRGIHVDANMIWIVGDGGVFLSSADGGTNWSSQTLAGGASLLGVRFLDLSRGWIVGASGTLLHTTDGGATWIQQPVNTTSDLNFLAFTGSLTGYAAGAGGTLLKTTDAGLSWEVLPTGGWTNDLTVVDGVESAVYVAGTDGFCRRSVDGGQTWEEINLRTDTRTDVNDLSVFSADSVAFLGSSGSVRRTANGGSTFEWGIHPLHATMSRMFFYDHLNGWACADQNNVIIRTTDGGISWHYPPGTSSNRFWQQRLNATNSIGNTLVVNPLDEDHVYAALGRFIYMSSDRGTTWSQTATISSNSGSTHSFYISPKDTNVWVVAFTGGGDHVRRTTDRGVSWTQTLIRNFTSYGMPLEMNPDHPDTLLFAADGTGGSGSDGVVYQSTDFGATWDTLSRTTFRSPCDIVVVPESSHVIYVGDGVTGSGSGQMWRSKNSGKTWTQIYSVSGSEIPTISISRQNITRAFATAWGSGGVMRTEDMGLSWTQVASTGSTWGTDVAKDDPNLVVYGSYGTGHSYISTDGGETFTETSNSGSNYAYLAYDRATLFAQQSGGVYKYVATYSMPTTNAEAVVLLEPNGGESWVQGETEEIRWTSGNIASVKLEFRVGSGAPWEEIASDIPAGQGSYSWLVPNRPTSDAAVRVSDANDGVPQDMSDGVFSITVSAVAVSPESLWYGSVRVGESKMDTVRISNGGTATLVVSSVETGSSVFVPGRTSFTIEPGASDTLSVVFSPVSITEYRDTLVMTTNAPGVYYRVGLAGTGESTVSVEAADSEVPREYVLEQNYPNPFNPETEIRYGVAQEGRVRLRVYNMLGEEVVTLVDGHQNAGWHTALFNGKSRVGESLASGLYLYRLEVNDFISTKKMIMLK